MKVLYVGCFKTGTKTMNEALKILGYRVSEMQRNYMELRDDWDAFRGDKGTVDDLKRMFEGYDATGDAPAYRHWRLFLEAFPDIKLILTTRDVDAWVKSWQNQLRVSNDSALTFPLGIFSQRARAHINFINNNLKSIFGQPKKRGFSLMPRFFLHDEEVYREFYKKHVEDVMKNAPRDNLLVYSVTECWQPLCDFLAKPIPDVPFPHLNKKGAITQKRLSEDEHTRLMYREMYRNIALIVIVIAVVVAWFFAM